MPLKLKRYIKAFQFYLFNQFVTNIPSYSLRRIYLAKILGYSIHRTVSVHMGCFFTGFNLKVGSNSVLNRNGHYDCRAGIEIGSNVSISPEVYILSSGHDPQSASFAGKNSRVLLQDFSWVGAKAILLPGVAVGKGAVVGAGSVVTKNVESFDIVAGNPAVKKSERTKNLEYTLNWFPFFNTDID